VPLAQARTQAAEKPGGKSGGGAASTGDQQVEQQNTASLTLDDINYSHIMTCLVKTGLLQKVI